MVSFYSKEELQKLGLGRLGHNVLISKKASIYCPEKLFIGNNVRIDDFCVISCGKEVEIGDYVHISAFVAIFGGSGVSIGNCCSISSFSSIFSESDDFSGRSLVNPWYPENYKPGYKRGKIVLKNYSNIGSNCTIMPGVSLHEGAAVGAHSLVLGDCHEWSIYCGCPAKRIKQRSRDIIRLEKEFLESLGEA